MLELAFNFETDPQMGVPRLTAVPGTATVWSAKEVQQVEDQLRPRYDSLVREGEGTLEFKGKTLHVKKKDGDTTRQPTLEIRVPPAVLVRPSATKPVVAGAPLPPACVPTNWYEAWLDEIEVIVASERALPAEAAMLKVVRDELRGLVGKTPPRELALLLFVSAVALADQLSRTHQPGQPHPYPFALSGLRRLLDAEPPTPWGALPPAPNPEPPPSWFARFWNLLKGE